MPLWDKLRSELDRAGRAAQGAIDEGRLRLEAYRARQLADKAAQALGYAVYRARQEQRELEPDIYARLASTLAAHEADAERYERELRETQRTRRYEWAAAGAARPESGSPADTPPSGNSSSGSGDVGASGGSAAGSSGSAGAAGSAGSAGAGDTSGTVRDAEGHQPL